MNTNFQKISINIYKKNLIINLAVINAGNNRIKI